MDWITVLTEISSATGLTQAKLASKTGVNSHYIYDLLSGKSQNPKTDFIIKLINNVGINPGWLFSDDKSMFLPGRAPQERFFLHGDRGGGSSVHSTALSPLPNDTGIRSLANPADIEVFILRRGSQTPERIQRPDTHGFIYLPLYNQAVAAGSGQDPTQLIDTDMLLPVFYDLMGSHKPENCGIARVVGDSLADLGVTHGDYVVFDRSELAGDGIFVITLFSETRVKRLKYKMAEQKLIIASENAKRYPEAEEVGREALDNGNLLIHGRVFTWMHKHPH